MMAELIWIFIQIGALITIPIAVLRSAQLWFLLRTGQFVYRPLNGERVATTRSERPGWFWWGVIYKVASLVVSLAFIGFVGFWTFNPR